MSNHEREIWLDVADLLKGRTVKIAEAWTKISGSTRSPQYTSRQGSRPYHIEDYPNGREEQSVVERFMDFITASARVDEDATSLFMQRVYWRYERVRGRVVGQDVVQAFAKAQAEGADVCRSLFDRSIPVADKLREIDEEVAALQTLRQAVESQEWM